MRAAERVALVSAVLAAPVSAPISAQDFDVLERSPLTSIYIETAFEGNDGRTDCDWYLSSAEFLESPASDDGRRNCRINLTIRGTITRDGAMLFSRITEELTKAGHQTVAIFLDSRGGDADAAIDMARRIRRHELFSGVTTRIAEHDSAVCFSACIVIFAAGYQRVAEFNIYGRQDLPSRLGIHGPGQFDSLRKAYDTSAENSEIARVKQALIDYFSTVGVSSVMVEDMFAIPFDDIRLLSEADAKRYGLIESQD